MPAQQDAHTTERPAVDPAETLPPFLFFTDNPSVPVEAPSQQNTSIPIAEIQEVGGPALPPHIIYDLHL